MSLIKPKFNKRKAKRAKLSIRNKIEYLHTQLKKIKAEKNSLAEELYEKEEDLQDKEGELIEKEEELQTEKAKVNDMKKHIECPVCLDVPRKGPV